MKKLTALLLALVLLLSLAACGAKNTEEPVTKEPAESTQPETQSESDAVGLPEVNKQKPVVDAEVEEEATTAAMELAEGETIVCDSDTLGLKITGCEQTADGDFMLYLSIVNKTDRNVTLNVDDVVVNGWYCDPYFSETLDPGESIDGTMFWYESMLDEYDIENVTQISFDYEMYDVDNYDLDSYAVGRFVYQPLGADAVQIAPWEPDEDDIVVFENDKCAMVITDVDDEGTWGYELTACLINKTDYELMFSIDDARVNGADLDPFWAWSVPPQARSVTDISWYPDDLTNAGITSVTEIELDMVVYNNDDWSEADILAETFTIQP